MSSIFQFSLFPVFFNSFITLLFSFPNFHFGYFKSFFLLNPIFFPHLPASSVCLLFLPCLNFFSLLRKVSFQATIVRIREKGCLSLWQTIAGNNPSQFPYLWRLTQYLLYNQLQSSALLLQCLAEVSIPLLFLPLDPISGHQVLFLCMKVDFLEKISM